MKLYKALLTILLSLAGVMIYCQSPRQIMPLGNSITQGDPTHLTYRYNLWVKLNTAGYNFNYVGSQNTNSGGTPTYPDTAFDRDHEGHWGWRADELLAGLPGWLTGYTPDIVLMHVGTNDMLQNQTVASTVDELESIIDILRADNPSVTILLAKLIGTTNSLNSSIVNLNNQVDAIASEKNTAVSRVIVVDQYTGFNASTDTYDGVHPDADGEEKMAQKWFDAIIALNNIDTTPPSVPSSLSASNITTTSFTLSWNASTDATGVTGYEIFRNGISIGTSAMTTFNVTGLSASTTYSMSVRARDAAMNWSQQSNALSVTTSSGTSGGTGDGLRGRYFHSRDFTGAVINDKVDAQINFDWALASPAPGVRSENFCVRWTGKVEAPVSGNFVFSTISDDGVRVWLNGVQIINNWTDHGPTTNNSTPIALTAGNTYDIIVEYYDNLYGAVIRLLWAYPGQAQQAVPQSRLYSQQNTGGDTQAPSTPTGLNASNITTSSFTLTWTPSTDNTGVTEYEIFRNGTSILTSNSATANITGLNAGSTYAMTVRARDAAGNWSPLSSSLDVTTEEETPGNGSGLTGEYFNNTTLSGNTAATRTDPQINFDWALNAPAPGVNSENFSIRWTGKIQAPATGNYIFSTTSDDGVRLWINNVLVINNWTDHGPTTNNSAAIALTNGVQYDIRLEYYDNLYGAVIRLLWSYPGQVQQTVPSSALYPQSSGGDTQPPSAPSSLSASSITQNSFVLSWNPSTDNTGVTGYEVFRDGASIGNATATNITVNGLTPSTTYSMTVRARDGANNWSALSSPLTVTTLPASTSTNGLLAAYYNNVSLTSTPAVTRTDATVNFDWVNGAPATGINPDYFSVRWTGLVEAPTTGNYIFSTMSDDGIRLWINNVQVINNWTDHGPTMNNSSAIALVAGQRYDLRLEYYERTAGAVARLYWTQPGQAQQIIPSARLFLPATNTARIASQFIQDEPDNTSMDSENALDVYPNPVKDDIVNVRLYAKERGMVSIQMITPFFENVVSLQTELRQGYNSVELHLPVISNGFYFLVVKEDHKTTIKKMVVER